MDPLILHSSLMNFCIYGLGSTGMSVVNYFKKKNFLDYQVWDDDIKKKKGEKIFSKHLDLTDYIVVSPGISLKKAKLKNLFRTNIKLLQILTFSIFLIQK